MSERFWRIPEEEKAAERWVDAFTGMSLAAADVARGLLKLTAAFRELGLSFGALLHPGPVYTAPSNWHREQMRPAPRRSR